MDATNLEGMKRAELQKLAKKAGIKANKKTDHLISELKKYYMYAASSSENTTPDISEKSDQDTGTSQTESFTTATSEHETTTESESDVKPKVTRGRRSKKATKKTKKAPKASSDHDTDASEVEETKLSMAEEQLNDEKADTPPQRITKPRKGRRGRKRAAPSPAKDATPAKVNKKEKSTTPKPVTPAAPAKATTPVDVVPEDTKQTVSKTPKSEEIVANLGKKTPHNEPVTMKTTRGSSSRRAAKKVATPKLVVQRPSPAISKTVTPVITDTKSPKRATRGSSGRKVPKRRRSTFEIVPASKTQTPKSASPAKEEIKSDPKMKAAIMAEIEKKAAEEEAKQPTTRIPKPRFGQQASKPVTPGNKNWAKIHAAKMSKTESIDEYLERKRKRTENMCVSVKRAKIVAEEAKAAIETLKSHRTPPVKGKQGPKMVKPVFNKPKVNLMSPNPANKATFKGVKPKAVPNFSSPAFKRTTKPKTPVAPTTATKSVSFKVSKLKTPKPALAVAGGKSLCQKRISTPGPASVSRKSVGDASEKRKSLMASGRKSVGNSASQRKSVGGGTTPFKFGDTTTSTTPSTAKKPVFDIKASLSKGLTYKPHTGKLKPLGEKNYHFSATKSQASASEAKSQRKMHSNVVKAKAELKKPKLTSRQERRAGANKRRAGNRGDNMMARRGIQM